MAGAARQTQTERRLNADAYLLLRLPLPESEPVLEPLSELLPLDSDVLGDADEPLLDSPLGFASPEALVSPEVLEGDDEASFLADSL